MGWPQMANGRWRMLKWGDGREIQRADLLEKWLQRQGSCHMACCFLGHYRLFSREINTNRPVLTITKASSVTTVPSHFPSHQKLTIAVEHELAIQGRRLESQIVNQNEGKCAFFSGFVTLFRHYFLLLFSAFQCSYVTVYVTHPRVNRSFERP
jgi:hypothetical protein